MSKPTKQDLIKIISLIIKKPESEIKMDANLRADLGMDSLAALDLLVSIEEQFGIVIAQEKASDFKTLQDVSNYLDSI